MNLTMSIGRAVATASFILVGVQAAAGETVLTLPGGIDATLTLPEGGANAPAVLMLPGWNSNKDEYNGMFAHEAAALAERGIASLRLSFRGFGASEGDAGDTTVDHQIEDAVVGAEALRAQPGVDPERLGILGMSFGGGVAIIAASEHPDWFTTAATWSSAGDFDTDMKWDYPQAAVDQARAEGSILRGLNGEMVGLKAAFFDSLEARSIADAAATLRIPLLAVAGSTDSSADYVSQLASGEGSEAWVIPGADHHFNVAGSPENTLDAVIARTADWFEGHL